MERYTEALRLWTDLANRATDARERCAKDPKNALEFAALCQCQLDRIREAYETLKEERISG